MAVSETMSCINYGQAMQAPTDAAEKPTILVVDDTPENLMLISDLLRPDFNVKVANSGARALVLATTGVVPHLVLLDIMMPGMDGYEVCSQLKNDPVTRLIPVVFLTAMASDEDEQKAMQAGAAGYLTKPVSASKLMDIIKTNLPSHHPSHHP
jgi:putative two-component system response regulator